MQHPLAAIQNNNSTHIHILPRQFHHTFAEKYEIYLDNFREFSKVQ